MTDLKNISELENGKIIILFSTKWCPDCIVLDQFIDSIIDMYCNDFKFIYADRDEHLELAKHYNVFGIPSFVCLDDGVKIGDFVSKESKTKVQIMEFLDEMKGKIC